MAKYDPTESAWQHAWRATGCALHTKRFWGAELIALAVSGGIAATLASSDWSDASTAWFSAGIALATALTLVVLVLVGSVILAPYQQRNKARTELQTQLAPIPLPNRADLIKAMSALQEAAIDLVKKQEELDCWGSEHPYVAHGEVMTARDQANDVYQETLRGIRSEKLVAGKAFEQPISNLITYISTQVALKLGQLDVSGSNLTIPDIITFVGRIVGKVKEAVNEIDKISQQASHKG